MRGFSRLLGVVAGAFALVALAGVAGGAGRDLDAVQLAHVVFRMMAAAGDVAVDGLVLGVESHGWFTSVLFWGTEGSVRRKEGNDA